MTAGQTLAPLEVRILDGGGALDLLSTAQVTVSLQGNAASGALAGTLTRSAVGGVATFDDLTVSTASTGYTLRASASGLVPVESQPFAVSPAAADRLAFVVQPSAGAAGLPISPAVEVEARDAFGNLATGFVDPVTIAIGTNPSGATLAGTLQVNAAGGVARFDDLQLDVPGAGYELTASAPALAGAASTAFDAVAVPQPPAPTAQRLVKTSGDGQAGVAGTSLGAPFVVTVEDLSGNPAAGVSVTFSVTGGGGSLSTVTATTDAQGEAQTTLTLGAATGTNTVTASGAGLIDAPQTFTATGTSGSAAALVLVSGDGQTGPVGSALAGPLVARVVDANGNPVPGVSVGFAATAGGGGVAPATATTDA